MFDWVDRRYQSMLCACFTLVGHGVIFWGLTALYYQFSQTYARFSVVLAVWLAGAVMIGFVSHLVLPKGEKWAVLTPFAVGGSLMFYASWPTAFTSAPGPQGVLRGLTYLLIGTVIGAAIAYVLLGGAAFIGIKLARKLQERASVPVDSEQ